jgi:hypothetical protein
MQLIDVDGTEADIVGTILFLTSDRAGSSPAKHCEWE